jgi:hypothetical protein
MWNAANWQVISLIVSVEMKASHLMLLLFCIRTTVRQCDPSSWRQK